MLRLLGPLLWLRLGLTLLLLLGWLSRALALEPTSDPNLATVRITSHGVSGTIIATSEGKSWILSCAHMFLQAGQDQLDPRLLKKKFHIDGPAQPYAPRKPAHAKLLAVDPARDLALL